jgi:hypothetical protein
VYACDRFFQQ